MKKRSSRPRVFTEPVKPPELTTVPQFSNIAGSLITGDWTLVSSDISKPAPDPFVSKPAPDPGVSPWRISGPTPQQIDGPTPQQINALIAKPRTAPSQIFASGKTFGSVTPDPLRSEAIGKLLGTFGSPEARSVHDTRLLQGFLTRYEALPEHSAALVATLRALFHEWRYRSRSRRLTRAEYLAIRQLLWWAATAAPLQPLDLEEGHGLSRLSDV